MRWLRTVFDARAIDRARSSNVPGLFCCPADGEHRKQTAQVALSRRIALRHGAAPDLSPRTEGETRRVSPLERWFNPRVEHRG